MNPTLIAFIKKEFIQTLRDKRMRLILFVIPVVQMTIFGLALSNEIKDVRLAVYAEPSDRLAQKVGERASGSGWFHLVPSDEPDPFMLVRSGRADAVLVAPAGGWSRAVVHGKGDAQLLVDATNAIKGRVVETYMNAIVHQTFIEENLPGVPPETVGVVFRTRVLYNPTLQTSAYLVPGVMGIILCLVTVLLASMSMARERELGTFETLIAAPVARWEIFLGKTLPYMILGMADVPLLVGLGVWGFHVPLRGPLWAIGLASLVFVGTTVAVGTLISTYAKNQQQAMMGGFLFLFPAILLSGVMAPIENVPVFFEPLSWMNPLRFFVSLMRHVMLKGSPGTFYWTNLGALAALGALATSASVHRFRRTLG
ncbi:MAG: ABC transporter permease [Elusimicrobia bacterium]|jgi:ABC-2 type transport system permease protein|nr:ABC transporter permease [Elusimicrobiota bacterium]